MNLTKPTDPPRDWQNLRPHPIADVMAFGTGIDIMALADHMRLNGYDESEPVALFEGLILDGRHRLPAAAMAEVIPAFVEFSGTHRQAVEYARKKLLRQHYSISQLAMFADGLAKLPPGSHEPDLQYCGADSDSLTRDDAAKALGVSVRAVDYASVVNDHGAESLKRAVRVGKVKVSDAAKVARKTAKVQDYAVGAVERGEYRTVAAAATLCPRCEKRVKKDQQPTTNCPACDDIRKNGKPKKTPKVKAEKPKPAPEQQTFGWAEFKSAVTGLHAFIDSLGRNDKPQLHERLDFLVEMIGPEASHEKNPDALFNNERADTGPYRSGR